MKMGLRLTPMVASAILASCSPDGGSHAAEPVKVCIDQARYRVEDERCAPTPLPVQLNGHPAFVWWYIRSGGYYPYLGSPIGYGSPFPEEREETYRAAPNVVRGGFGRTAAETEAAGE